ncbi:MAG: hypothetical protein PQJ58_09375 [Spirochaetales bacterium]|nr:hypothetical protein [Spirochaetales bacterium]
MKKHILLLSCLLITVSCTTTVPVQNSSDTSVLPPAQIESASVSVTQSIHEFNSLLDTFNLYNPLPGRNIDNRDWLMQQINFWSDRDQIALQRIYEEIKYSAWDDDEKADFLKETFSILSETRQRVLDDFAYLIDYSTLLNDTPWMVRDFYDERSEFSYWYLSYMGRAAYPYWLDSTVLPAMLRLIPDDRITAVTYLWLKNTDKLESMKTEIYNAGYPWSRLIYLLEMSGYLKRESVRLLENEDVPELILAADLL